MGATVELTSTKYLHKIKVNLKVTSSTSKLGQKKNNKKKPRLYKFQPATAQRCRSETQKFILEDLFSSV